MTMKRVGVIIPLLNEEKLVSMLVSRIQSSVAGLPYQFQFIFVDDGSSDNTLRLLLESQKMDARISVVKLSRNWGFQCAYNAGIDYFDGDAAILMDGDLEDPPELIKEFLAKWEEGFDVVYAIKESRQESRFKKSLFTLFYILMERFSMIHIDQQAGMFSLLDKAAFSELKKMKERHKYYVGLRFFLGFRQVAVSYHREPRYAGVPKQSFRKLLNYALNAFFSFSFLPIRLLTYLGILILAIDLLAGFGMGIAWYAGLQSQKFENLPYGTISFSLLVLAILSVQIIFLGIIGEYIVRIFDEVRNRPYYIVERVFTSEEGKEGPR